MVIPVHFSDPRKSVGERHASPQNNASGSLPTIIGSFKSAVTKRINRLRNTPGASLWQRAFYDRIIRDEKELDTFRAYIRANPLRQEIDIANGPLDEYIVIPGHFLDRQEILHISSPPPAVTGVSPQQNPIGLCQPVLSAPS